MYKSQVNGIIIISVMIFHRKSYLPMTVIELKVKYIFKFYCLKIVCTFYCASKSKELKLQIIVFFVIKGYLFRYLYHILVRLL